MLEVVRFPPQNLQYYHKALEIREKVFIEEQNVPSSLEIENEQDCTHYLLFENNIAIGTARWRNTQDGIKLERFAVLSEHRNGGKGTFLLKYVLRDLRSRSDQIYLNSQLQAISYYERQGFKKEGDIFEEAGILHYKMILKVKKPLG